MASDQLRKALAVTAELFGKEFSPDAAHMLLMDLEGYPEAAVLTALTRCRRELSRFPSVADILARIEDGRPGAEEAWALLPKTEADSAVCTEEMMAALSAVRGLLERDEVAARMAFREAYLRHVTEARARRRPTRWIPTLGHDKGGHERAVIEAVERGRLTADQGAKLLPDFSAKGDRLLIAGPTESDQANVERVREFVSHAFRDASAEQRIKHQFRDREVSDLSPEELEARRAILRSQAEALKRLQAADPHAKGGETP